MDSTAKVGVLIGKNKIVGTCAHASAVKWTVKKSTVSGGRGERKWRDRHGRKEEFFQICVPLPSSIKKYFKISILSICKKVVDERDCGPPYSLSLSSLSSSP